MIEIKNLTKSFGSNQVLNDLNLEIKENEILFIVGKSGSGKSVLLKHIIGLIKPDHGEVLLDGIDMTLLEGSEHLEVLRNIGMIFQGGALFDSMSVGENVTFHLKNHGVIRSKQIKPSEIRKLGEKILEQVGLKGTYDLTPSELSGGMQKRASVARGVIFEPEFLFYDEPTTGLDPITAQTIAELIVAQHSKLKGTTIAVSHDIVTTLYCADRIALIENGRIEVCAPPKEFLKFKNPSIERYNKMIGQDLSLIGHKGK